jgi:hypothetical protein
VDTRRHHAWTTNMFGLTIPAPHEAVQAAVAQGRTQPGTGGRTGVGESVGARVGRAEILAAAKEHP